MAGMRRVSFVPYFGAFLPHCTMGGIIAFTLPIGAAFLHGKAARPAESSACE